MSHPYVHVLKTVKDVDKTQNRFLARSCGLISFVCIFVFGFVVLFTGIGVINVRNDVSVLYAISGTIIFFSGCAIFVSAFFWFDGGCGYIPKAGSMYYLVNFHLCSYLD